MIIGIIKIYQSVFVRDLVIERIFTDCNINIISIKASSCIKMTDLEHYKNVNFHIYQRLIRKLIYLSCSIRPDIIFVVEQLNRYNANLRKDYL